MAVLNNPPRQSINYVNGQATSTVPFEIFTASQVQAFTANGTTLVQGVDYNVDQTTISDDNGFTVDWLVQPITQVITFNRSTPIQRLSGYTDNGEFVAQTVNDDFDLNIFIEQEISEQLKRTVKLPVTTSFTGDLVLPDPVPDGYQFG